jgi:hypothetical protein
VKVISPLDSVDIKLAWASTSVAFSPASTEVNYSFYEYASLHILRT